MAQLLRPYRRSNPAKRSIGSRTHARAGHDGGAADAAFGPAVLVAGRPVLLVHGRVRDRHAVERVHSGDGGHRSRAAITGVRILDPPSGSDGAWHAEDAVEVVVEFSEPVTVLTDDGTPFLAVDLDSVYRTASYSAGSGTAELTFSYRLPAGHSPVGTVAVNALRLGGGRIVGLQGTDADLAHEARFGMRPRRWRSPRCRCTTPRRPRVALSSFR